MNRPAEFDRAVVAQLRSLRAFARSLTKDRTAADDLTQETVMRALVSWEHFQPGTNLGAWLFTVMRNRHYETSRRNARLVEDPEGLMAMTLEAPAEQEPRVELSHVLRAIDRLKPDHRQAILFDMNETPYEEVAREQGLPLGTVKSRLNRARKHLVEMVA